MSCEFVEFMVHWKSEIQGNWKINWLGHMHWEHRGVYEKY